MGMLPSPAYPVICNFFEMVPIRLSEEDVILNIKCVGPNREGDFSCKKSGCTEVFKRLDRAILHYRTQHLLEKVNLVLHSSAVTCPQVLCTSCDKWVPGKSSRGSIMAEPHGCSPDFQRDYFESHPEFYQRKVRMTRTRRCGPLRRPSSSSCRGLWPSAKVSFWPLGQKKIFLCLFVPKCWSFLVLSSDLSSF